MTARPALHRSEGSLVAALFLAALTVAPVSGQSTQEERGAPGAELVLGAESAKATKSVRADYEWTLRGLDGRTFELDRYRGKPLVLNIWATWCAPCVAELSSLERLAESLAGDGIEFLIVSPEPVARVLAFMRRHGYELPAAVEDQRMPASYGLRALPTTYVLDGRGRIVLAHRGATDWDRDVVRDFLLRLAR